MPRKSPLILKKGKDFYLKREKRKGKYYVVLRDRKGKISTYRKWGKDFRIIDAIKKFKGQKVREVSFNDSEKRIQLTNVVEKSFNIYEGTSFKIPSRKISKREHYAASVNINGRRIFSAGKTPRESVDNLANAVSKIYLGYSDTDEGYNYIEFRDVRIERVSYAVI